MFEAPEHRLLTTQINIAGHTYIGDDAAFATRDGLIVDVVKVALPFFSSGSFTAVVITF